MRKKGKLLSIAILLGFMLYPNLAYAAESIGGIFGSTDTLYTATTMNADETSFGEPMTITNNGKGTNFYLGIKATANIAAGTEVKATLSMTDSNFLYTTYESINGSKWTVTCTEDPTDATKVNITAKAKSAMTAGQKDLIAKIKLDASGAADSTLPCTIRLSTGQNETPVDPDVNPKCKIVDGKYYDNNGNEVTKDEYTKACATPENPQTGSFLPYAIIIGGIALAGGLYFLTKKNKIYHI